MHKTIILDKYYPSSSEDLGFFNTNDGLMYICQRACELLSRQKSSNFQYVATFSDEYSLGYYRVQVSRRTLAYAKRTKFQLGLSQRDWLNSLGLKTLNELDGHFYVKITPFKSNAQAPSNSSANTLPP